MSGLVGFLGAGYPWVMALHVIFVIFLMAGLFMMPRFFIYHSQCAVGSDEDKKWIEREDRLRRIILNPSLVIVWIFGLLLAFNGNYWGEGWFIAKFLLVLGLSGYHGWAVGYARKLAGGRATLSGKRLRLINEMPAFATIAIVLLVIVKPSF